MEEKSDQGAEIDVPYTPDPSLELLSTKVAQPTFRQMRIGVLVVFHLLWLCLSAWLSGYDTIGEVFFITQIGASMGVIALIAALGPGTILHRGVAVVVTTLVLSSIVNVASSPMQFAPWLQYLAVISVMFAMLIFAAILVYVLGSYRSWRIGPECLPPVRMTILTIMLVTATIGGVYQAVFVIQKRVGEERREYYQQKFNMTMPSESDQEIRFSMAMTLFFVGGILFILSITSALATRNVAARCAIVFVPIALTALIIAIERPSRGQPLSSDDFLTFGVFIVSSILAGVVVAMSVAQVGKAGWVFSRRLN